jgi:UDP-N-acetylmuramate dehydrogenase
VGGPARFFTEAEDEAAVIEALGWAQSRGLPVVVLGGGSNMLIADRGLEALVLRIGIRGIATSIEGDVVTLTAGAGEPWEPLVERAVSSGWAGIECLSGIPGDTGAAPIQNVGAYGQEVAETIARVRLVERATGSIEELDNAACGFGYRDSIFKREARDRYAVVGVTFTLRRGGAPAVRYAELERRLAATGGATSLAAVRDAVLALRRSKSMLLDPADENGRSAGSFFMNPVVSEAMFSSLKARLADDGSLAPGEVVPSFPGGGGLVKLSAAWLIERAGFRKGTRDGSVGLSTRHALAIVNRGGASAAAIVAFASRVKGAVEERFGVRLVPEPALLGFEPGEIADLVRS